MSQPPPPYPGDGKGAPLQGYGPPPQGQYPPPGAGYPPPGVAYPPPGGAYPPPGQQMQANFCPAYGMAPPPGATTVVVSQPQVTVVQTFRDSPVRMRCPFCQADIVTATTYEVGGFTWLICVILCLFVGIFGLIPFCVDSCKDAVHHCPSCNQQVGRFSRM